MSVAGGKKTGAMKCWKKYSSGSHAVFVGFKFETFNKEGVDFFVSVHNEEFMRSDIRKGSSWIFNLDLSSRLLLTIVQALSSVIQPQSADDDPLSFFPSFRIKRKKLTGVLTDFFFCERYLNCYFSV